MRRARWHHITIGEVGLEIMSGAKEEMKNGPLRPSGTREQVRSKKAQDNLQSKVHGSNHWPLGRKQPLLFVVVPSPRCPWTERRHNLPEIGPASRWPWLKGCALVWECVPPIRTETPAPASTARRQRRRRGGGWTTRRPARAARSPSQPSSAAAAFRRGGRRG